jgi:hypothetical protein
MVGYRRDFGKSILGANRTCGCSITRKELQTALVQTFRREALLFAQLP